MNDPSKNNDGFDTGKRKEGKISQKRKGELS